MAALTRDFKAGDLQQTTNPLDMAIAGRGFFVIEGADGQEYYTRNGQFGLNAEGELVTAAGNMVSPGIEIPVDAKEIAIAEDGTLTAIFADDTSQAVNLGQIRLADFQNTAGLRALGGNLFAASPESGQPIELNQDEIKIHQGFIETSNVDVAEELVNMIMAQRAFEMTSKAVESGDQMMSTVNGLKR
jgi:flagellar basal-body rod protein FlgG